MFTQKELFDFFKHNDTVYIHVNLTVFKCHTHLFVSDDLGT